MKKRLAAILLCAALALTFLPAAAMAGGGDWYAWEADDSNGRVHPGETATLIVDTDGDVPAEIVYEWFIFDTGTMAYELIEGESSNTLVVGNVLKYADYACVVTDRSGKSDWVYLYVDVDNEFSVHAPDGDTYTTVSVAPGGSAVLTVEAEGYNLNGITYKWYDGNYNVIAGETAAAGPSYTLENVESTGYYYGEATDVYGSSRSVTFYVYVDNGFSAEAEQEYITVDPGQGAVMTVNVTAEDDSRVTYLWKDSNYNVVEGATTNTLTLERVTKRAYYRCTVSDGYGNSTTVLFTISIDNGFSAEAEEYAVVAAPGENAVMRVVVTAKDPDSVSFKWYDSGYNIIEGETSDSLSVDPTTGYGEYRCYVSDTYGSYANIYFTVSVDNSFSAEAEQESVEVAPGSDAVLKVLVSAADTSKVTYTWYGRGYYAIDGAESDSYTVENVTGYSSYYCYVSDGYGNYEYVYFYVRANNHFTAEAVQSNITVEPGEAAVMEVRVGGDVLTGVTYAWYDESGYLIEGEVTNSYTAADVTGSLSYRCYVSDGYGSSRSVWFYLGVDNNFSVSAKKTEYTAEPGESVVLKVDITATDSEGMTIVWRDDNYNVIEGAASDSYTIERVASRGWYYCRVEDKYGNYDEIDFYVSVDNGFSAKAVKSTVYAEPGTNAELRLQVTAKDTDGLTIRWYDRSGSLIEGAASDSYTVENVRAYSYYHCDVADKYGNSRTVWFYVYVDNGFSAEPEKMNVLVPQAGGTATLKINVSVKDADGLTIQWLDGTGSIIENAVTDTLTVENVLRRSEYRCRVADKYGSSASFRFSVGVDNGFSVWPVKRDVSAEPGGSAMMKVRLLVRDAEGLNVQWYDGDSNLIQGADALTYTAENVDGAQYYSCVVTDKYGNTGSVWFNVSVGNALSAKAERQNITVAPGETVVMKTLISARDKEGIAIKWYDANYRVINGATSDTLTLENYMRTSRFRCQATDRYGNSSSVWFYVDVENGFSASAVKEDFTVAAGTDVELKVNVTAADREDLRISWYDNEYEYIEESEDAASITVENVLTSCSYNCFVEDKYGNSETIWFYITVDNGFSAYAENPSVKVPAGGSAVLKLNVTATDKTGLEIRWYDFNHDPMEDETGYSVTVTNITRSMEYSCEVEDRYGNREFVWFSIGVDNGLSVRAEKQTQMVAEGGSAVLKAIVSAKDASKLEYRWYDSDYYQIAGLETDTLILDNITESEHYYCDVSDQYGNYVSAGFTVGVANGLSVTAAQSVFKVPAGGSAQLSAVISALDVSGLSIVWYKNGIIIPGAAQTSYTAENVTEYAEYRCEVTDRFGNSGNARFTVAVENAFSVIAEGSKSYVAYGEAVTLAVRCTAADMDGMTYKWSETFRQSEGSYTYYTSKPIPDALSDTLFIPSVTGKRMFSCTVSDKYGNSASLQFDVGVYNDLTVERIGYYNQYAPYGAPLTLSVQVGAIDTVGLECKWTKESNDKYSSSLGGIVLGTGTSYTIPSVTEAGRYVFSAADRFGNEEGCVFAVGPENGLTIELAAGTAYENYVPYGGSITVGFTASAIDAEGLTYQWDGYFIPVGAGSY
ncbi:MAG: immunoglobulin domain-containing protein, partial [Oscillospiraceae bacterium]|nr:immunoglobulin domain-containing protein [Oscillospiraceae bacterium]